MLAAGSVVSNMFHPNGSKSVTTPMRPYNADDSGNASGVTVQTTERYLGTRQDLVHAPNDAIRLNGGVVRNGRTLYSIFVRS